MSGLFIGIDTGGTFTDFVGLAADGSQPIHLKLSTSRPDPSVAILQGIALMLSKAEAKPSDVLLVVHGTTLATNTILEGEYAATGMLTTKGFADVLELARQRRPSFYNLDHLKPIPPARRDLRIEVSERLDHEGNVVRPLEKKEVVEAVRELRERGVTAVAICFLHSYADSRHEDLALEVVRAEWPEAYVSSSADVLPEQREFERFSTTTLNATLMPVMDSYLRRFTDGVKEMGLSLMPRIMQSNGGAVSPDAVRRMPINTFFSGPAGGVIGAARLGQAAGMGHLITFDVGGTSADVCLIRNGVPTRKSQREIGGFPVRSLSLDIHTIGAGGGSIAWLDPGGLLKVGPSSAGSFPGPAAYGRGGVRPTVTDANVVLGRLGGRGLLGGEMEIFPDKARAAVAGLADRLGTDLIETAAGIIAIADTNMTGAVRVISVEQGEDPRDYVLVPFGGAGPLHGVEVARLMQIPRLLLPASPGMLSASGLLYADIRGDFSLTRVGRLDHAVLEGLNGGFADLLGRGRDWLAGEQGSQNNAVFAWTIDMRYVGQSFELGIPVTAPNGWLENTEVAALPDRFHKAYEAAYGYQLPDREVEVVTLRLAVTALREMPPDPGSAAASTALTVQDAVTARRKVWFRETGFIDTPVYDRMLLPPDCAFDGPAVLEQMDTTTVVPPGAQLRADILGNLVIEVPCRKEAGT